MIFSHVRWWVQRRKLPNAHLGSWKTYRARLHRGTHQRHTWLARLSNGHDLPQVHTHHLSGSMLKSSGRSNGFFMWCSPSFKRCFPVPLSSVAHVMNSWKTYEDMIISHSSYIDIWYILAYASITTWSKLCTPKVAAQRAASDPRDTHYSCIAPIS